MLDQKVVKFRPLELHPHKGMFRPQDCNKVCGSSKCLKSISAEKCPTRLAENCECGGWAMNIKKPPTMNEIQKKIAARS